MSAGDEREAKIGYWWHTARGVTIDTDSTPEWLRTGYTFFPYAALQAGQWWVLRINCFPEHDLVTLFIDGSVAADVTAGPDDARPLVAGIGRLMSTWSQNATELPMMSLELARRVIGAVAEFVNYGSEWGDSCIWCGSDDRDPFTRADD
jgi:hypothetical protein